MITTNVRLLVGQAPAGARAEEYRPQPPGREAADAIEVSVVLPCLNEEESVGLCVEKAYRWFAAAGVRGEVIVVDNGSADASREEALRAGARVIDEPRRGYGYAHLRGFAEAWGDIIVMADADDTYDLLRLDDLIQPLQAGYDLVIGNRLNGGLQQGAMSWSHRAIGTPAITFLLRLFSGARIGDSQCGLRAFTREAYDRMGLRSGGMELASEMVLKASRRGLRVAEVPISYRVRKGESKLNTFRDGWRHLRFLLLQTPQYLFVVPGLLLLAAGLLSLIITLMATGGVSMGSLTWQPVFAGGVLLVAGTNALMIGMATNLYAARRGVVPEGQLTRLCRRYATLERALLLAALLVLAGLALDGLIFYEWVRGDGVGERSIGIAALAQSGILIGANVALGGFLTALIDGQEAAQ